MKLYLVSFTGDMHWRRKCGLRTAVVVMALNAGEAKIAASDREQYGGDAWFGDRVQCVNLGTTATKCQVAVSGCEPI